MISSIRTSVEDTAVSEQLLADDLYQLPKVQKIFDTSVIIQKCPHPSFYSTKPIIDNLLSFVHQFEKETIEHNWRQYISEKLVWYKGKSYTSCTADRQGEIAHFDYLKPLMKWIYGVVWHNRHYLKGGSEARGVTLGRNWINEMFEGSSGPEHQHKCPVAIFYVRLPENGADIVFINNGEHIPAGARQGDLLIHDRGINHSVNEHQSSVTRICIILEFDFVY